MMKNILGNQMQEEVFVIKKSNTGIKRGTRLELSIKDDQKELLEESKIKELIKNIVNLCYPLSLLVTKTRTVELEEEEEEEEEENNDENNEDSVKIEEDNGEETQEKKKKTKEESYTEWELVNIEK